MQKQYQDYMLSVLKDLMAIDSPSGFCDKAAAFLVQKAQECGYTGKITNKGAVEIEVKGRDSSKRIGVAAHTDTLGALVRSVSGDGKIRFTTVGSPTLPTLDAEYCRIYTREGKVYTGTFLSDTPSAHVSREAATAPRDTAHMHIRLDEHIRTAEDVKKLGIETGDYIAYDTKFTVTESGFVKTRFLDDKASVAVILAALKYMSDSKQKPRFDTNVIFTVNEEVGHGGSPFGSGLTEVLAVDMGCIGADLKCTEYDVSICAGDSGGPYNYELTGRLINLAKAKKLDYAVDLYPFYSSDIGTMLRAGYDIKGALIGAGIHASHGMERTHLKGLVNTYDLLAAYLEIE